MVRDICRDVVFLGQKSELATEKDRQTGKDLLDTLTANNDRCVGMAANMIGVAKNIIVVNMGPVNVIMYNPVIVCQSGPYETEEGCLSLEGMRRTKRYKNIEVEFTNAMWQRTKQKFSGWTAQIIQHECDHLEGVII